MNIFVQALSMGDDGIALMQVPCVRSEVISGKPNINVAYVHTGGRVIMKFTRQDVSFGTIQINTVTYYTDSKGVFYYDVTDELRVALNNGGTWTYSEIALRLVPLAGRYPENEIIPKSPMLDAYIGAFHDNQILPPSVILQQKYLGMYYDLWFELFGACGGTDDWQAEGFNATSPLTSFPVADGYTYPRQLVVQSHTQVEQTMPILLRHSDFNGTWNFVMLEDCERCCVIQWLSATGIYRRAIWRVKDVKNTAASEELLPMGDEYITRKSSDVQFTAYIEGLDPYSYYYYADVITSPDVHVAMQRSEDLSGYETRVSVETSNYTIPNGNAGELKTLAVTINYKHYDTL